VRRLRIDDDYCANPSAGRTLEGMPKECSIKLDRRGTTLAIAGLPTGTATRVNEALSRLWTHPVGMLSHRALPTPAPTPSFEEIKNVIRSALGDEYDPHFQGDPFQFDRIRCD
jgi:hypothetical protein